MLFNADFGLTVPIYLFHPQSIVPGSIPVPYSYYVSIPVQYKHVDLTSVLPHFVLTSPSNVVEVKDVC